MSQTLLRFSLISSLLTMGPTSFYKIFSFVCAFSRSSIHRLSYQIDFSLLAVGPGRECPLGRRISVHREPPRAAPSSRENRGHRRFAAPLLPVSRLITACHICTIKHTHSGVQANVFKQTTPCTGWRFYFTACHMCSSECGKAHQRDLSSSARMRGVGGLNARV